MYILRLSPYAFLACQYDSLYTHIRMQPKPPTLAESLPSLGGELI